MAIYPNAILKKVAWANRPAQSRGKSKPNVLIFHVAVSEADSLYNFFNKNSVCSHFYVRKDGIIEQYIDTDLRSVADANGNHRSISVETQGGVHNPNNESWTLAQLEALAELAAWCNTVHDIPLNICSDSKSSTAGISWHRRGIKGNWTGGEAAAAYKAGEIWSSSYGKICPGYRKIQQVGTVVNLAKEKLNPAQNKKKEVKKMYFMMVTKDETPGAQKGKTVWAVFSPDTGFFSAMHMPEMAQRWKAQIGSGEAFNTTWKFFIGIRKDMEERRAAIVRKAE